MVSFGQFKRVNCSPQCKIHGKSIRPKVCNASSVAAAQFSLENCGFGFYYFEFLHFAA